MVTSLKKSNPVNGTVNGKARTKKISPITNVVHVKSKQSNGAGSMGKNIFHGYPKHRCGATCIDNASPSGFNGQKFKKIQNGKINHTMNATIKVKKAKSNQKTGSATKVKRFKINPKFISTTNLRQGHLNNKKGNVTFKKTSVKIFSITNGGTLAKSSQRLSLVKTVFQGYPKHRCGATCSDISHPLKSSKAISSPLKVKYVKQNKQRISSTTKVQNHKCNRKTKPTTKVKNNNSKISK